MKTFLLGLTTMLILGALALPALAAPGGSSAAAKTCQDGGYAAVQGAGGERFADTGQCVSYAARGGTLSAIPTTPDPMACPAGSAPLSTWTYQGRLSTERDQYGYFYWINEPGWVLTSGDASKAAIVNGVDGGDAGGFYWVDAADVTVSSIVVKGVSGAIVTVTSPVQGAAISANVLNPATPQMTVVRLCG